MFNSPKQIIEVWFNGVNSCNLPEVIKLYDQKAILLPTFSNKCLHTPEGIRNYFEKLATHKDLHVALHENTLSIQELSNELYSMCGIYCWRFEVEGEVLNFEARFTFTVKTTSSRPIIHHHSSQVPRIL